MAVEYQRFPNKTVVGVSAGANILAKWSYSGDYEKIFSGSGILDIKTMCHYDDLKTGAKESFQNYHPEIPIVALREQMYEKIIL